MMKEEGALDKQKRKIMKQISTEQDPANVQEPVPFMFVDVKKHPSSSHQVPN